MGEAKKAFLLVVDDDPMVLSALERLLRHEFDLSLVQDLTQARTLIRQKNFDMALIDLHLAEGTSLDFFRELQTLSPTTARVLISGALNLNSLVDSLETNLVHKVLQKPWEPSTLILQIKEAQQIHELLKQKSHLEQLSATDALTGLYNYRYLQQRLAKELDRAQRQQRPLSVVMADVDGFKIRNDNAGHLGGDAVLKQIAQILRDSLRTFDCICRYGGDEFCIVLQETDLKTAFEISERLRKKVEAESAVTISLGVSCFPDPSTSYEELLAHADTALYSAKSQGRNRTVIAATKNSRID